MAFNSVNANVFVIFYDDFLLRFKRIALRFFALSIWQIISYLLYFIIEI